MKIFVKPNVNYLIIKEIHQEKLVEIYINASSAFVLLVACSKTTVQERGVF